MNDRKKLVPRLRFPEFRRAEGWKADLMGEAYSFKGNNSLSRDKLNYEAGSVKNIHYGDIHTKFSTHFDIKKEIVPYINTSESLTTFKVENFCIEGDMIFADASEDLADIGKAIEIVRLDGEAVVSGLHTILARQTVAKLVLGFGGHLFKSKWVRTQIQKESQGSKVLGLSGGRLAKIRLPFPHSPDEQQKIAECLSSLDELIAAQARKVDTLRTHKKGLMQQLFPREDETQPRLRFPEFQNAGEWVDATLGQLAKLVRGPFGGSLKKEIFVASGYAVYEQQHAIYSDFSSFRYHITADKFHELRRFAVAAKDIIMSCSGTMGKFAIIPDGAAPGVINQALLKLTPNGSCDTRFLKAVLELPSVQEKLLSQSAGGAIQNVVSVDQIKALPLRLPSGDEQQAVVDCLSSLEDLIIAQTQELETLKTHKKGLMQQLFPSPEAVEA